MLILLLGTKNNYKLSQIYRKNNTIKKNDSTKNKKSLRATRE